MHDSQNLQVIAAPMLYHDGPKKKKKTVVSTVLSSSRLVLVLCLPCACVCIQVPGGPRTAGVQWPHDDWWWGCCEGLWRTPLASVLVVAVEHCYISPTIVGPLPLSAWWDLDLDPGASPLAQHRVNIGFRFINIPNNTTIPPGAKLPAPLHSVWHGGRLCGHTYRGGLQ